MPIVVMRIVKLARSPLYEQKKKSFLTIPGTSPGAFLTPERRVSQPLETTPNPLSAPSPFAALVLLLTFQGHNKSLATIFSGRTTTFARAAADNSDALTQPGLPATWCYVCCGVQVGFVPQLRMIMPN